MKTKNLTFLALSLCMAGTIPVALADKPADKTTPERKISEQAPAKSSSARPTVNEQSSATDVPRPDQQLDLQRAPELDRPAPAAGSLSALIGDRVTFSTLKKALIAADLDATLGATGTYTILAPTDEAFDKLPEGTLEKLMLPQNKEKLRSLILYHVIPGQVLAAQFKDGDVTTMNSEKVKIEVAKDKIEVNDAKIFSSDVMAKNGVMHSIGKVLVPKSMENFSGLDR